MSSPAEYPTRIWFNPTKFWSATKNMTLPQIEQLRCQIDELAELRDLDKLLQFEFITVGNPYRKLDA